VKSRVKNCYRLIAKDGCDSLLVSNPLNITYLTGLEEVIGHLLITDQDKPILFTNFLYQAAARKLKSYELVITSLGKNSLLAIAKRAKELGIKRFGFEAENLEVSEYQKLKTALGNQEIKPVATSNLVETLRAVKEPGEIKRIKKSIQISKQTFQFAQEIFDPAMTEKELTIEIERFMRLKGDNQVAFKTIVASAKNTVFPHHVSDQTKIGNRFFLIDLGSKYYGYCADLTRVFFWGKMPLTFNKIYDTVRKSQAQAIAKVKDGVRACDVDKAAREVVERRGWGKYFGHNLGHGIGLAVHEEPRIGPKNTNRLKEGMVITIEPGIYYQNRFGLRWEDMVLVTKAKAEVLSEDSNR